MIHVSETARQHFQRLIQQQAVDGLGLRVRALNPGTPNADIEITFCEPGDVESNDIEHDLGEFKLFIDQDSTSWLGTASIDFENTATGGSLSMKAPGLKGQQPGSDAPLQNRVQWLLDSEINPQVASHGGHVSLVEITSEKIAVLQFGGGCQGCGQVSMTLSEGIEKTFKQKLPEITGVRDVTDHEAGENPYFV